METNGTMPRHCPNCGQVAEDNTEGDLVCHNANCRLFFTPLRETELNSVILMIYGVEINYDIITGKLIGKQFEGGVQLL